MEILDNSLLAVCGIDTKDMQSNFDASEKARQKVRGAHVSRLRVSSRAAIKHADKYYPTRARERVKTEREKTNPPLLSCNTSSSVVYHSLRHVAITRIAVKDFTHM